MAIELTREQEDRFWVKVRMGAADHCWPWTACRTGDGYGAFSLGGRMLRAHRVAYTLVTGPIPEGGLVLHRCDYPPCCNPNHLYSGVAADNVADRVERSAYPMLDRRALWP